MTLILDASAALSWMMDRENADEARISFEILFHIQRGSATVPLLWFTEVLNGVLVAERRSLIAPQNATAFLVLLEALPIDLDRAASKLVASPILSLARAHNLTAYDATYLELAARKNAPLATFDQKLAQAARSAGISVFGDN